MSNDTSLYIGAYLEIHVWPVTQTRQETRCENGHRARDKFCPECGSPVSPITVVFEEMPAHIVDDLLPDEWVDILTEITPPSLHKTGVILARANSRKDESGWYYFSKWGFDAEVKSLPTEHEQEAMISDMRSIHADIISEILKNPAVKSIEYKCGIVVDMDY